MAYLEQIRHDSEYPTRTETGEESNTRCIPYVGLPGFHPPGFERGPTMDGPIRNVTHAYIFRRNIDRFTIDRRLFNQLSTGSEHRSLAPEDRAYLGLPFRLLLRTAAATAGLSAVLVSIEDNFEELRAVSYRNKSFFLRHRGGAMGSS